MIIMTKRTVLALALLLAAPATAHEELKDLTTLECLLLKTVQVKGMEVAIAEMELRERRLQMAIQGMCLERALSAPECDFADKTAPCAEQARSDYEACMTAYHDPKRADMSFSLHDLATDLGISLRWPMVRDSRP